MRQRCPQIFALLSPWERKGLIAFVLVIVAFGVFVEYRSTCLQMRKTDLTIYLRAAWALRIGQSPYGFTTKGDSHYNYPPLLAILLLPFADNPDAAEAIRTTPFAVSVALWYALGVLATLGAVHLVAASLEQAAADAAVRSLPLGCRRWRTLRVVPLLVCLPGFARTLALGQVDLLVLLLLCGMVAATVRQAHGWAGFWLAGAACIKLIPAFVLVYLLWRRDVRGLVGFAVGLFVGLVAVPAATLGVERAWQYHRQWAEVVVLPAVGLGADRSRESDLTSLANVHSQSLSGVLHAFQHPDRAVRPAHASPATHGVALAIGLTLTLMTLVVAGREFEVSRRPVFVLGMLMAVMLLLAPICHPHYFCHWLPLVTGLTAWDLERRASPMLGRRLLQLFVGVGVANALTSLPGLELLRDRGLAMAAGIALWSAGLVALWPNAVQLTRSGARSGRWSCPRIRFTFAPARTSA